MGASEQSCDGGIVSAVPTPPTFCPGANGRLECVPPWPAIPKTAVPAVGPARCGRACGDGQACAGGDCVCEEPGTFFCTQAAGCVDLLTDPANCGTCAHDCLGGACLNGNCQPIEVASAQSYPFGLALDSNDLYWINGGPLVADAGAVDRLGEIVRFVVGGNMQRPTVLISAEPNPVALAAGGGLLFWLGETQTVAADGGGRSCRRPQTVHERFEAARRLALSGRPTALALDPRNVYWIETDSCSTCTGSGVETTVLEQSLTTKHAPFILGMRRPSRPLRRSRCRKKASLPSAFCNPFPMRARFSRCAPTPLDGSAGDPEWQITGAEPVSLASAQAQLFLGVLPEPGDSAEGLSGPTILAANGDGGPFTTLALGTASSMASDGVNLYWTDPDGRCGFPGRGRRRTPYPARRRPTKSPIAHLGRGLDLLVESVAAGTVMRLATMSAHGSVARARRHRDRKQQNRQAHCGKGADAQQEPSVRDRRLRSLGAERLCATARCLGLDRQSARLEAGHQHDLPSTKRNEGELATRVPRPRSRACQRTRRLPLGAAPPIERLSTPFDVELTVEHLSNETDNQVERALRAAAVDPEW